MKFIKDININRMDSPYILFLLIFTSLITINLIFFNNQLGIYCSDVFIYLLNSLNYAGVNIDANATMYLSPVLCMITGGIFRLGYVNVNALYIVTGIFAIFGNLGFYILLKKRFNKTLSLIGSILLFSLSLNLLWLANGTLDIPAIGLSIWSILFFTLAVDKNPKYYIPSLLLFVLSIFTRYTAGLIIPVLLIYFFGKYDLFQCLDKLLSDRESFKESAKAFLKTSEVKYIIIALITSVSLTIIFLYFISGYVTNLGFLSQSSAVSSGLKTSTVDSAFTTNTYFYITNFLNFLFSNNIIFKGNIPSLYNPNIISYLVFFITIIGLIIGGLKLKYQKKRHINLNGLTDFKSENKIETVTKTTDYKVKNEKIVSKPIKKTVKEPLFKTKKLEPLLKLIFIITLIFAVLSFDKISSTITLILISFDILILNSLLKNHKIKYLNLDLAMIAWFLVYLIAFTYINIKVNRYILTVMPAFVYFFTVGLNYISQELDFNLNIFKHKINTSQLLAVILIIIFVFSAFTFTSTVTIDQEIKSPELISNYLKHYDPDYESKNIGVYNKRPFSWFLHKDLFGIDKYHRDYLEQSDLTYYISNEKVNLTNYHQIQKEGNLYLYQRNNT